MAQDHFQTPPDPKKAYKNQKMSQRSEGRAKRGPELLVKYIVKHSRCDQDWGDKDLASWGKQFAEFNRVSQSVAVSQAAAS